MDSKIKKIDQKNIFFGVFSKIPPWGMLIGSCMPNFIDVARLKSYQKSEKLWLKGERKNEGLF